MKQRNDKPASAPATPLKRGKKGNAAANTTTGANAASAASDPGKVTKTVTPVRSNGRPLSAKHALACSYIDGFKHPLLRDEELTNKERRKVNKAYKKWMDERMERGPATEGGQEQARENGGGEGGEGVQVPEESVADTRVTRSGMVWKKK